MNKHRRTDFHFSTKPLFWVYAVIASASSKLYLIMKLKHKIDFKGLENYLKTLSYSDIETNWQKPKNAKLIEGHSIEEIEYFKNDKSKIPLEQVINYGEPFLVDALGNDLSIVILSKRKYKLPTGRAIHAKFVTTVLDDCRSVFGRPINGYWKIPSQFIKPLSS